MNGLVRPLVWIGSSRRDLSEFPRPVRRDLGIALFTAQQGQADPAAKPMKGFSGASVVEIVSDYRSDTWRAIYTVAMPKRYTFCTHSRRNRSGASLPQKKTST
ncbi:MAG: type II toxin-antitoxin system RelE/ParE family toxin [Terracidiphilus sp.]